MKKHQTSAEMIAALRAWAQMRLSPDERITLAEAQLLDVCRICKAPSSVPFEYDYGREYAHTACLTAPDTRGSE